MLCANSGNSGSLGPYIEGVLFFVDNTGSTLLIFLLLLACSAFFSSSETALTKANRVRLKSQEEQGNKAAGRALRLTDEYDRTLSTLLIGNNIVNTLLASLATIFCTKLFGGSDSAVGIATAAVTVLVVIFGEVAPKTYAGARPEVLARLVSGVILALQYLFYPLTSILKGIQKLVLPQEKEEAPTVTEDEFALLFDQSVDEGVLEEERSELLQNALAFDDIIVDDILTPRVNIVAVELHDTREEVTRIFLEQQFSRLPVYEKDLDHIVGVISQKDFFAAIVTGSYTDLQALMQPCLYVPTRKKIDELMTELRLRRTHVAIVTDEYGGTSGLVTLEDILEQLVGDIWDEHDQVTSPIRPLGGDRWEIAGDATIQALFETLCEDDDPPETDATTVAGLALEHLEHLPAPGESFICGRLELVVTQIEEKRIRQLHAIVHPPRPTETEKELRSLKDVLTPKNTKEDDQ